jgi:poly(beta-D-mannuronate) lyase
MPRLLVFCFLALALSLGPLDAARTHAIKTPAELTAAVAAVQPGDTLVVADGTYADWLITLTGQGTPEAPITLRAATPGRVILTGNSRLHVTGSHLVVSGFRFENVGPATAHNIVHFDGVQHGRLTQCAFFRCGNSSRRHIVRVGNTSRHCRVDHNYFERLRGQGIGVTRDGENTDNRIDRNWLNRTEGDGGENNGFEPIQLGAGGPSDFPMRALVEYNLIENMLEEDDADPELISVKSGYNRIFANTFRGNSPSRNLTLRSADHCVVEGNFLLGCYIRGYGVGHRILNNLIIGGRDGIHLPGGEGKLYADTRDCLIAHNTILNPEDSGIEINGDGASGGPRISRITVLNNIVIGAGDTAFYEGPDAREITYGGNIASVPRDSKLGPEHAARVVADPRIAVFNGKLRDASSPAVNAGVTGAEVAHDIDGTPRDARPDVGAYEYTPQPGGNNRPLTPSDVGPAWLGGPPETE